ncbi:MAG: hypothetical protein OXH52_10500 [Gammaproteobacteria bacterium]|nr:hypothetical protein [Gammaproteobacteria bacterium]
MPRLRLLGLVALGSLSSACQSQQQQPPDGAYLDFVIEVMTVSGKLSEGPSDAKPATHSVETWRGAGESEEGTD